MDVLVSPGAILLLVLFQAAGVEAADGDIIGITVAGFVSLACLGIVITFIAISFSWSERFNTWMRQRGQVRMPKEYFKRKKEEAKRRLLAESANQSLRSDHNQPRSRPMSVIQGNGGPPIQAVDRGIYENVDLVLSYPSMSRKSNHSVITSWIHGWNQTAGDHGIESLDATMVLGDEQDEEFKIETVLVDNEVLDVGPYKGENANMQPVRGDVYNVPYIYSAADDVTREQITITNVAKSTPGEEITHVRAISPSMARDITYRSQPGRSGLPSPTITAPSSAGEMVEIASDVYTSVAEPQKLDDMVVRL